MELNVACLPYMYLSYMSLSYMALWCVSLSYMFLACISLSLHVTIIRVQGFFVTVCASTAYRHLFSQVKIKELFVIYIVNE